jgi:hypothetical protein
MDTGLNMGFISQARLIPLQEHAAAFLSFSSTSYIFRSPEFIQKVKENTLLGQRVKKSCWLSLQRCNNMFMTVVLYY